MTTLRSGANDLELREKARAHTGKPPPRMSCPAGTGATLSHTNHGKVMINDKNVTNIISPQMGDAG